MGASATVFLQAVSPFWQSEWSVDSYYLGFDLPHRSQDFLVCVENLTFDVIPAINHTEPSWTFWRPCQIDACKRHEVTFSSCYTLFLRCSSGDCRPIFFLRELSGSLVLERRRQLEPRMSCLLADSIATYDESFHLGVRWRFCLWADCQVECKARGLVNVACERRPIYTQL